MPRWAIVVAMVVALVPATYLTAHRAFRDSATPASQATDLPIPPVTPSGSAPTSSPSSSARTSPTGTSSPSPTAPARQLPRIAPDAPRRITSGQLLDAGFDSSVADLDASSDAEVARWDPRGSPGSPGTDTVYVVGRARADGNSAFAGLARIEAGAEVAIRTDAGTMTYTVGATRLLAVSGLAQVPLFREQSPGRLVLVGIRYDGSGNRLTRALVVTAQLTGATRA